MGSTERLSELTEILAAGLIRLKTRKSSGKSPACGESLLDCPAHPSVIRTLTMGETGMTDPVLAQLAALKSLPVVELKAKWRDLFKTEPPAYNRRFLEHRLSYRIQELAYGGLKPETLKRLKALGDSLDGGDLVRRRKRADSRPISGTRLIREYQGVEHCVTVRDDDFEYQGRPYKSLSAIARLITGTRWNGLVFFGLKNQKRPVP